MKNLQNISAVILGLVLVVGVSFYIFQDLNKSVSVISKKEGTFINQSGITIEAGGPNQNYKVEVINNKSQKNAEEWPKMPDLSRKVVNYSKINEPSFENASKNIADLTKGLGAEPKSEGKWLDLASFRKMIGDYEASLEILNYVVVLWPNDYVPFNNLADLYHFHTRNYPLAEKNWLKVIEINPSYEPAYDNLYMLYNDLYEGKQSQALPILLKGLKNNPESISFLVSIARHYRKAGDLAQAKIYYDKAIAEAQAEKNTQLETSLRSEMAEISQ